jgi:hypothetical protein
MIEKSQRNDVGGLDWGPVAHLLVLDLGKLGAQHFSLLLGANLPTEPVPQAHPLYMFVVHPWLSAHDRPSELI